MRRLLPAVIAALSWACGSSTPGESAGPLEDAALDTVEEAPAAPATDGATTRDASHASDAASPVDAAADHHVADASHPHEASVEAGPGCGKSLTVVFSVGTGSGALSSHAGGCWSVVDADGAANHSWRKCSTGNWVVGNPSAPNWAFDDSNPTAPLSEDQSFLTSCSKGSTGQGFEYLAYRGSWRLLFPATHLDAFFAELYSSNASISDLLHTPGVYAGNAQLANHTVYPMINVGPTSPPSNEASVIEADALAMCKTVKDGGMFGVYVGTWNQPMPDNDPRIVALAKALDTCTN